MMKPAMTKRRKVLFHFSLLRLFINLFSYVNLTFAFSRSNSFSAASLLLSDSLGETRALTIAETSSSIVLLCYVSYLTALPFLIAFSLILFICALLLDLTALPFLIVFSLFFIASSETPSKLARAW